MLGGWCFLDFGSILVFGSGVDRRVEGDGVFIDS